MAIVRLVRGFNLLCELTASGCIHGRGPGAACSLGCPSAEGTVLSWGPAGASHVCLELCGEASAETGRSSGRMSHPVLDTWLSGAGLPGRESLLHPSSRPWARGWYSRYQGQHWSSAMATELSGARWEMVEMGLTQAHPKQCCLLALWTGATYRHPGLGMNRGQDSHSSAERAT